MEWRFGGGAECSEITSNVVVPNKVLLLKVVELLEKMGWSGRSIAAVKQQLFNYNMISLSPPPAAPYNV